VVDMSREAISARLRAMARLLEERGFVSKGVDMSCAAITHRLQSMAALSTMCLRLGKATIINRDHT
jgi:predicted deacylase